MLQLLLGQLFKVSLKDGLWSYFFSKSLLLYFFCCCFFEACYMLSNPLSVDYICHCFMLNHYIIIFVLMAIYHICIRWTVFYELLSSISNISLVHADFLFTFDYLNSCFCRLIYWETTTDLEGSTFPRLNDSVAFFRVKYSLSHFWSSLCICFLPNIFLSKMEIFSLESLHQNKKVSTKLFVMSQFFQMFYWRFSTTSVSDEMIGHVRYECPI